MSLDERWHAELDAERRECSERIFSGQWDIGGHQCSFKPALQTEDGRWWCKRHHPDAKHARAVARDAAMRETKPIHGAFNDPPTGAFITVEALRGLLERSTR